jgi:hypothetical protein
MTTAEWCARLRPVLAEQALRNREARCALGLVWYLMFARRALAERPPGSARPSVGRNFCARYLLHEGRGLAAGGTSGDPWPAELRTLLDEASFVLGGRSRR